MLHIRSLAAQPQPPPPPDFFFGGAAVPELLEEELEVLLPLLEEEEDEPLDFFLVAVALPDLVGAASLSLSPVAGALASAVGRAADVGMGGGNGAGAAMGVDVGMGGGGGAASSSVRRKMRTLPSTATTAKMPT